MKNLFILILLSGCASDWRDFQNASQNGGQFWNNLIVGMAAQDREDRVIAEKRGDNIERLEVRPVSPLCVPYTEYSTGIYHGCN